MSVNEDSKVGSILSSNYMTEIKSVANEETQKDIPNIVTGTLLELKRFQLGPNPANITLEGSNEIVTIIFDPVLSFLRYQSSTGNLQGKVVFTGYVTANGWREAGSRLIILFMKSNDDIFHSIKLPFDTNCAFSRTFIRIEEVFHPHELYDDVETCGVDLPGNVVYRC